MTAKKVVKEEEPVVANSASKIVKYFAIGLAACIIVGVISGLAMGGAGLLEALDSVDVSNQVDLACEENDTSCLTIALAKAELEVKTGDTLKVEANSDKVEVKQDGNKLFVKETGGRKWFSKDKNKITIFVPADLTFDKIGVSGGVGNIETSDLKAKVLEASLGVGRAVFNNLMVSESAKFNCGIGQVVVGLTEEASAYEIKLSKGLGDIKFNGESVANDSTIGQGNKKITISGGIGEIVVNTK